MKQYKIFAPVLLAVLGLASFEKNESGVLALTDEQKQTLMNDHGWEAKFLDQFNAALAVNFEDAQATQEGDETPTTLANLDTLNETARALAESQTALAALQADKNALEVDKAAMQKKVNDLTTQVDVLSRKPEHDAGAGAQTPNQMQMVKSIKDNDMLFALGPAGSGKTYTAVALAVRALKAKQVKRIILTRPAVEAGENLGF